MINLELINIDINKDVLNNRIYDINIIKDLLKDEKDQNKIIRDILDNMGMYNITIRLYDINMLQYTLITTIKNNNVRVMNPNEITFDTVDLYDETLEKEYYRLISQYMELRNELSFLSNKMLENLEPNTRLVNIELCMSIKEFIEFLILCSKYDELMDIVLAVSNNEVLEGLVTILWSLKLSTEDLYMRMKIDNEIRNELSTNTKLVILSNSDFIKKNINEGNPNVKLTLLSYGNFLTIRDVSSKTSNIDIKLENPKFINREENPIDVILPNEFGLLLNEDQFNKVDKYIYDWVVFINKLEADEKHYYYNDILACYLGCFGNVFRMNNTIEDYFKLSYTDIGSEVIELLYNLKQEL